MPPFISSRFTAAVTLPGSSVGRSIILALFLWAASDAFAQTIWTDGTGDWFNAANWSAGVPNLNTSGRINNGGHAQIAAGGATGQASLGFGAQDSGTLSVSGSGRLDGEVEVGVSGTGTLNITNGGVIMSGRFVIANESGSSGIASVSGSGSRWTNNVVCIVGFRGNATLNITNGGKVSYSQGSIAESDGSVGLVTVDGLGSALNLPGTLTVAGNGAGTLIVKNGGDVFTDGSGGSFGSGIGRNPGSNGVATITGAGSAWRNNGSLGIGDGFTGTSGALHIANGGAVSNSDGFLGGLGGIGTVTVDGVGSTWTNNGDLFIPHSVPRYDGAGTVTITQGGFVSGSNAYLGYGSPTSTGTVNVDGAGSKWINSGNLFIGGTGSESAGVGILRIENCGMVSASATTVWRSGVLEIGSNASLKSALTFNGGTLRAIANTAFSPNASLASGGVVVDSNSFNTILHGVLSGAGGLTKQGSGMILLTNVSTYTGATTVSAGSLLVNGSIASSAVTVSNSGSVLGGTGTISGPVIVNSSAALLGGDGGTTGGSLTVANNLTLNSASVIRLVLGASGAHSALNRTAGTWIFATNQAFAFINVGAQTGVYDNIITGLPVDPGGTETWTITTPGFSGTFTYDGEGNIDLTISAAPPPPTPTLTPTPTPGLVANVATRLPVGTGNNVLIEGFIVQGPLGSTKEILVRALGPSLHSFGITDALANPTLEIRDASNATVATNNDWKVTQAGSLITGDQSAEISATGLSPSDDLESAIIANLAPGNYTAVVRGLGNSAGTGVVDAYDIDAASCARLANFATRGLVQPGDKLMIAGFIVQNGPVRAVIRAIGPSLTAFGIANALPDTTLQLRDQNGVILLENDDWKTTQRQDLEDSDLQPTNDLEAALIMTLPPGQYTAQVRGKGEASGIGVVQVYFLQ